MKDTISVIIPIYKVEKYLEKCIQSVINQTYTNLQIILVDDGSPDNCGKICDEYSKKDSRIEVIHKANGGISDARNVGISKANGKYITFVDPDDYILKNMYEILYENLIKNNADISICKYKYIKETEKIDYKLDTNNVVVMNKMQAMKELLINKTITNHLWNKLYKKETFDNIQFPTGKKYEDLYVMYLLFEKSSKIVYQDTTKYIYINREQSILHNKNPNMIQDYINCINNRYMYLSNKYEELEKELNYNLLFSILNYHVMAIGGKLKEFYNSEVMENEYKKLKNIKKDVKKSKMYKKLCIKYRIFLYILLFNKNFTYKLFEKMY